MIHECGGQGFHVIVANLCWFTRRVRGRLPVPEIEAIHLIFANLLSSFVPYLSWWLLGDKERRKGICRRRGGGHQSPLSTPNKTRKYTPDSWPGYEGFRDCRR